MIQLFTIPQNISVTERDRMIEQHHNLLHSPGVLLQTCNRTEFYFDNGEVSQDIVSHLFRVVSGLESNLIGEVAIQGQVKSAYLDACSKFNLSKGLHILFQNALRVGKKVRTHSGISHGAVSHSLAATQIIAQSGIDLNKAVISLIGAHKMNEDIIRFLQNKGAETFFLATKTFEKAEEMANKFNCKALKLNNMAKIISVSDVLITATSAPHLIVNYDQFPANKNILIIDLAAPADVDIRIGELPGVTLFNLQMVENFVNQNLKMRKLEIVKAENIVNEEVEKYFLKQQTNNFVFLN